MVRIVTSLLVAAGCARATWLRWSVNHETVWAAKETGHVTKSEQVGWTPRPTPAPGVRSDGEVVLDLLKRQSTETDWTNSETCGWFSGISSSAYMCGNGFTCATNENHAVACASGTFSPFYSACLDYSAYQAGSCASLDPATGCCEQSTQPACGTYIWTGKPERFMYQCFETASIVSLLDVPQFVVDASIFSKTHTTPQPTSTQTGTGTGGSAALPGETQGSGPGSGSGPGHQGSDSTTNNNTSSGSGSGSSSTPAIVGGVVGGIIGLLLLLLLLWYLRRRTKGKLGLGFTRKKKSKKENNARKDYHTTNIGAAGAAKRKDSSGSETTVVPIAMNIKPQHHYHNREKNSFHTEVLPQSQSQPQVQPQHVQLHQHLAPQTQGAVGGQQPASMSYTVNEGTTHMRQPSYTSNTSYTMPSGAPHNVVVNGIIPTSHHANEGTTHMRQPSYTSNTSYTMTMPQAQSGTPHHFVVGGIVPASHHSNESQQPRLVNEGMAHVQQPSHTNSTSYTMSSTTSGVPHHVVVNGIVPTSHHSNESQQPQHVNGETTLMRQPSHTSNTSYTMSSAPSAAPHHVVVNGIVHASHHSNEQQQPQHVNDGAMHMRQPSYASNTSYSTMPSAPSGAHNHFVIGGGVPMSHNPNEPQQQQPQFQPQPQFQQVQPIHQIQHPQPIQPQLQPINHIHVYYAPPMHTDQPTSNPTSQSPSPSPSANTTTTTATRAHAGTVQDVLNLYTQPHHERARSHDQSPRGSHAREHEREYHGHGHSRDVSTQASRSVSPELEWMGGGGPGYRQSM
ncbi:hypothetical protein F4861DRAFT_526365 [Xylaria intraflava]|nr:hypothetical protein F4861DRAFT_526365 [Xylaria intraflava]